MAGAQTILFTAGQTVRTSTSALPILAGRWIGIASVSTKPKGNVDAELVLQTMIEYLHYERAVIVTSDGDCSCLVRYLYERQKLERVLSPNRKHCSALLKQAAREKLDFLEDKN